MRKIALCLVLSGTCRFRSMKALKGKAFNGWGASAIITYQSGFPIRVQDANDSELESSTFSSRVPIRRKLPARLQFIESEDTGP